MTRKVLILLTAVLTISIVQSQELANSMWKISGNGLENSSYLFGTYHLFCPDDLNLGDKSKKAITQSEQVVMELDYDNPQVMRTIRQNMAFGDSTLAEDYLNEREYQMVSDFFTDTLSLPFERVKVIKPFFLYSMTLGHFLGCQRASFEQKLCGLAKENNLEVLGLETPGEQLDFVDSIPLEEQKNMLVESIRYQDSTRKMFDTLVTYYLNEELMKLNTEVNRYMSKEKNRADLKNNMLIERNKRWIKDIENMIANRSSFIAVGAGHLAGGKGLIRLLRKAGYTVKPVK